MCGRNLSATWYVERVELDGKDCLSLVIQLAQDYRLMLTTHADGGSLATFYRDANAGRGFAGDIFEFAENEADEQMQDAFSAWLDEIVLAHSATP
jgi:hypothetical protein